jgi:hypothetical protein
MDVRDQPNPHVRSSLLDVISRLPPLDQSSIPGKDPAESQLSGPFLPRSIPVEHPLVSDAEDQPRESELSHRLRHGQTDLDDAIALLRAMQLDDIPPASIYDPGWEDVKP